jgi:predicted kinase
MKEPDELHGLIQPKQKRGVFMAGAGGSGKSHYISRKFTNHRLVRIDPDAIKEDLAHHDNDPNGFNTRPEHYHEESSDIAKQLHGEAMKHGRDFLYDGTGANEASLRKKLSQTKAAGYETHIHHMHVPLSVSLERNAKRARTVPEHVIREQHAQVRQTMGNIRHDVDHFHSVYNMNDSVQSPYAERRQKLLESKKMQKALARFKRLRA